MQSDVRQVALEGDAAPGRARDEDRVLLDEGAPRAFRIATAKPADVEVNPDRAASDRMVGDAPDVARVKMSRPPATGGAARRGRPARHVEDNLVAGEANTGQMKSSQVGKQGEKTHGQ